MGFISTGSLFLSGLARIIMQRPGTYNFFLVLYSFVNEFNVVWPSFCLYRCCLSIIIDIHHRNLSTYDSRLSVAISFTLDFSLKRQPSNSSMPDRPFCYEQKIQLSFFKLLLRKGLILINGMLSIYLSAILFSIQNRMTIRRKIHTSSTFSRLSR